MRPPVRAPTKPPVRSPTPAQTVRVTDFYLSFVAPDATREPTSAEYAEMVRRIEAHIKFIFAAVYTNPSFTNFINVKVSSDLMLFGDDAGIPTSDFNIYIHFDFADFTFSGEHIPDS
jgi:hypothetical protein